MTPSLKANCICLLLAVASVGAVAQTAAPKTREQVRQELVEALRDGSVISGEAGLPMRDLNPGLHLQAPSAPMRTRDSVRAELEAARRSGDLLADGDTGLRLKELYPTRYPQPTVLSGKTRVEVKAELAEARRTGEMLAGGDSGLKLNESSIRAPTREPWRRSTPTHRRAWPVRRRTEMDRTIMSRPSGMTFLHPDIL